MKYLDYKPFSIGVGERPPEVCARVGHSTEPDRRGNCLFCGEKMLVMIDGVLGPPVRPYHGTWNPGDVPPDMPPGAVWPTPDVAPPDEQA